MQVSHTVYLKVWVFLCPCYNAAAFQRVMRVCAFNGPTFTDLSVSTGVGSDGEKTGGEERVWERKRGGEARRQGQEKKTLKVTKGTENERGQEKGGSERRGRKEKKNTRMYKRKRRGKGGGEDTK